VNSHVAALLTGLTKRGGHAVVVIEYTGVEHRDGSIDRSLDPPPQVIGIAPPSCRFGFGTSFIRWQ
jgi:hypothetical protein